MFTRIPGFYALHLFGKTTNLVLFLAACLGARSYARQQPQQLQLREM